MRIIVIGGGASGVVCAIHAKNVNNEVIILEKNDKLLKKLLVTGNGRCNYFNDDFDLSHYYSFDTTKIEELIQEKNIWDVKSFFDSLGIIPRIKDGWYYPFTNQASTVRDALIREVHQKEISVFYNTTVLDLEKKDDKFLIHTKERDYYCDKVVLASGSFAYPNTGSDGVGYSFLKKFGHTIIPPVPALVQLVSNFPYCKEWDGVRSEVELELVQDGEVIAKEKGEIQLTDYGVSGICIFNLSHLVSRGLHDNKKEEIRINFVPFIETLITPWMDRYSRRNSSKNIGELLEGFLNKKLVPIVLKCSNLTKEMFYDELTTEEKINFCKYLNQFTIEITSTKGYDQCQICNGGLRLKEVDLETMESHLVDGLYITGELLDLNGECGGYNLTECWITGLLAGKSIGEGNDSN